jgi:hypothetical protein
MKINFINTEIDLQDDVKLLQEAIILKLNKHGEPLRWAITDIDKKNQKVTIEAVVIKDDKSSIVGKL